ncbi:MAG: CoA-transferase, partial [Myxococcota bacterium]
GSTFDSATSFAMIRGGHVDLAILGAMQVSQSGDLANWSIPGGRTMGIGGAMDLAAGAQRILVLTTHVTKKGAPKLVESCNFPITALGVVSRIITDLAVIDVRDGTFHLVECAPGVDAAEVREKTGAPVL